MNKVVLYIKDADDVFQAVDLFEDETISVTSKIQDIRDISKVFTDFSQSFTLPASKKNNKIFKHFYNYFISEGAFDARKKSDAVLEINYIPFREGKVFLNGVKMKENKPFAYNVTFFGNTVNLKDTLGDDELTALDLSDFNHNYGESEVRAGLTTGINFSGDTTSVIYPLISHTKRLYFDSRNPEGHNSDTLQGNLSRNNTNSHSVGAALEYTDLKPALKVSKIIDAIEDKYNLQFTSGGANDFFGSTPMSNLYMWLSREKGQIGGELGIERTKVLDGWTGEVGDDIFDIDSNNIDFIINDSLFPSYAEVSGTLSIFPSSGFEDVTYSVNIILDGNIIGARTNVTGSSFTSFIGYDVGDLIDKLLRFEVKSKEPLQFDPRLQAEVNVENIEFYSQIWLSDEVNVLSRINIFEQIPKIKTIDFISGIFKMFNLTAFFIEDRNDADYGKIKVMSLDDFYDDDPQIFDITKYVDSKETDIEATIPFSEIDFEYKEPKTLLQKQHEEVFDSIFGDEEFKPNDVDRGKPYKVKVPFEHLKFERLLDVKDESKTRLQWGYSAGNNFKPISNPKTGQPSANYEPVLTAPILFYGIRETSIPTGGGINFRNGSSNEELSDYWRPSNTNEAGTNDVDEYTEEGTTTSTTTNKLVDSGQNFLTTVRVGDYVTNETDETQTTVTAIDSNTQLSLADDIFTSGEDYVIYHAPEFTLNFDNEIDEWSFVDYNSQTNSLFKKFYKTYIEDAFNAKKRIFKLTAHLPSSILLNYKLNDRFQIGDKVFTINSIDTNLKTGESKLELLNVL